ncbi:uncharacterized protein LOC131929542 [Physella acuta]|uniref:uncharacterized protein LOC131929542 n=1 Tax=Physella acuta TaxID=109671 RepID=UPI0027DDFFE8|nr:uncharacterized protein LOC131929542 [Physella acuta]
MALSFQIKKLIPLLSGLKLHNVESVRFKSSRGLILKRRRPLRKWFDPADKSWAEPIFKYNKEKAALPDPEPSVLHMVYRIKDHYTRPYWEKDILKEFGLFEKSYNPVVIKNTPEINEKLKVIQHLVHIKPVTFPYGLPKDESDYKHCYLTEKGEFVVRHRITDQSKEVDQAWAEVKMVEERKDSKDVWKMDKKTLDKETRSVLQHFRLSAEYFKEKYVYKYNQDGKEHRYKNESKMDRYRQHWY